jgi:hypothetical protein
MSLVRVRLLGCRRSARGVSVFCFSWNLEVIPLAWQVALPETGPPTRATLSGRPLTLTRKQAWPVNVMVIDATGSRFDAPETRIYTRANTRRSGRNGAWI